MTAMEEAMERERSDGPKRRGTGRGPGRRQFLGASIGATAAVMAGVPAWAASAAGGAVPLQATGDAVTRIRSLGVTGEEYWKAIRREFKFSNDLTYLNVGTLGPVPQEVLNTRVEQLRRLAEDPRARADVEAVRKKAAAFVGADADEIVITRSTTEGMKLFSAGLDLRPDDEVLMTTQEHEGGEGPWRARAARHGVRIREVEIPSPTESVDHVVGLVERAITAKTRVLLVSHPIFITGLMMPIRELTELAHRKGLLISVDGAHALGMLALDLHALGVDHYAGAGQKWLMAGSGTGLAYVARGIQPRILADMPARGEEGVRQYEHTGSRDVAGVMALGAALDFHDAIGRTRIEARVRELAGHLRQGLAEIPGVTIVTPRTPLLSGGLTTFTINGVSNEITRKYVLDNENIYITGSRLNGNTCRVSTHFYTLRSEIDRLLDAIRRVAGGAVPRQAGSGTTGRTEGTL